MKKEKKLFSGYVMIAILLILMLLPSICIFVYNSNVGGVQHKPPEPPTITGIELCCDDQSKKEPSSPMIELVNRYVESREEVRQLERKVKDLQACCKDCVPSNCVKEGNYLVCGDNPREWLDGRRKNVKKAQ